MVMRASNTTNNFSSVPQKILFGLSQNTKEDLSKSVINNIDKLLNKSHWTVADAVRANIYAFIPPGFPSKNTQIQMKTTKALRSKNSQNSDIYATCHDICNWLNLVNTWAKMHMTEGLGKYIVTFQIIRTAIHCEHVLSDVPEFKKKEHLYILSFDQFTEGKQNDWNENIELMKIYVETVKSIIKTLLRYNRTIKILSEAIAIKELVILYADVQKLVDGLGKLNLYINEFRESIEKKEVNYVEEFEKHAKTETIDKLSKILNKADLVEWTNKDLNDTTQYPELLQSGLEYVEFIQKFNG
jgi:hypothetical protein